MIQVTVTNTAGVVTNQGTFPDANAASVWLAQEQANGSFGQNAIPAFSASATVGSATINANTAGIIGNVSLTADGTRSIATLIAAWNTANPSNQLTVEGDGTQIPIAGTIILTGGADPIPAAYTVTQTDVTAQLAAQALVQKGMQAQQVGAQIIAQVYALNEQNIAAGSLTAAQLTAMLSDTSLAQIERLLWNGSLATALAMIQASTTLPNYFSSAQIAQIKAAITASGLVA